MLHYLYFLINLFIFIYFFTLQYYIGFAIHQHASAMGWALQMQFSGWPLAEAREATSQARCASSLRSPGLGLGLHGLWALGPYSRARW